MRSLSSCVSFYRSKAQRGKRRESRERAGGCAGAGVLLLLIKIKMSQLGRA